MNWETLYQENDMGWDRGDISPALTHALKHGLSAEHRILIPGCGLGHEVLALVRLGFDVTALDIAPSAIKILRHALDKENLSATLVCGDLFEYEAKLPFDAIYEQTCLCALPPENRAAYAKKIQTWLRYDGVLYFSMMQTGEPGGPPYHCDWAEMKQLFDAARWHWQEQAPLLVSRPKGNRFELVFRLVRR